MKKAIIIDALIGIVAMAMIVKIPSEHVLIASFVICFILCTLFDLILLWNKK